MVRLTTEEMRVAANVGIERRLRAIARGREHRWEWDGDGVWNVDIHAAASELLVAKLLGRYWNDAAAPDADGDVGARVQVRWTSRRNGCLLLHKEDSDDHAFFLVVGVLPELTVAGWIMARDGKNDRYWKEDTGRPAYFVPREALTAYTTRPA